MFGWFKKKDRKPADKPSVTGLWNKCKDLHETVDLLYLYAVQVSKEGMNEAELAKLEAWFDSLTIVRNRVYNLREFSCSLEMWRKEKLLSAKAGETLKAPTQYIGDEIPANLVRDVSDWEVMEARIKEYRKGQNENT